MERQGLFKLLGGASTVALLIASWYVVQRRSHNENYGTTIPMQIEQLQSVEVQAEEGEKVFVDVKGAVISPGVYELPKGARTIDAIEAAAGLADNADLGFVQRCMNMAKVVSDEEKIYVPLLDEHMDCGNSTPSIDNTEASSDATARKVNINTATKEKLETLPGVGPSTAEKIIEGRPYSKIEDLMKVKGIGEKTFDKLKDLIEV